MERHFEEYLRQKNIAVFPKDGHYELYWGERSIFHDYTHGWRARQDFHEGVMNLDFILLVTVDIKRFSDIFNGISHDEIELSYTDEIAGRGSPCFTIKIDANEDYDYGQYADLMIFSLTDVACASWKKYLVRCSEEEIFSFNAHYGDGQRLLFIDKYIMNVTSMARILRKLSGIESILCKHKSNSDPSAVSSFDDVFSDISVTSNENESEESGRWIIPNDDHIGGFKEVAGMKSLKEKVGNSVIWPLKHKQMADKYKVSIPGGMLLYGPPGCGKSYFAEKFAQECGLPYRLIKPSELGSPFVHASQNMIANLFDEAAKKAPCVICLDEIDAIIPSRNEFNGCRNDEVNEFLTQLNNCGKRGIFVIGTTNMKDLIDPAALRKGRLDYQIEIPAPNLEQRITMFEYELDGRPVFLDVETGPLAEKTDGFSCSDISYIVNEAALNAAIRKEEITQDMLEEQIRKCSPSLKNKDIRKIGFAQASPQSNMRVNLAL